jgi:hypothetical protein
MVKTTILKIKTITSFSNIYYFTDDKLTPIKETSFINTSFRSQHTGKLKDVLSAWCSDLGLSYYWDPFRSALIFVTRSKPLSIPTYNSIVANESAYKIIDLKYGETTKSTFSRGFLGFFSKEGEIHNYTCSTNPKDAFFTLHSLQTYNASDLIPIGLSYYSKSLFSAWSWLKNGGSDIGINILSTIASGTGYEYLNANVLSQEQIASLGGSENFYYIIANCDENYAQKIYENYQAQAGLLGKYWALGVVYPVVIGSYFDENNTVQVDAAGGGG